MAPAIRRAPGLAFNSCNSSASEVGRKNFSPLVLVIRRAKFRVRLLQTFGKRIFAVFQAAFREGFDRGVANRTIARATAKVTGKLLIKISWVFRSSR